MKDQGEVRLHLRRMSGPRHSPARQLCLGGVWESLSENEKGSSSRAEGRVFPQQLLGLGPLKPCDSMNKQQPPAPARPPASGPVVSPKCNLIILVLRFVYCLPLLLDSKLLRAGNMCLPYSAHSGAQQALNKCSINE